MRSVVDAFWLSIHVLALVLDIALLAAIFSWFCWAFGVVLAFLSDC
jgi:hypothetical protein